MNQTDYDETTESSFPKPAFQDKLSNFYYPMPQGELKDPISSSASFLKSQHISNKLNKSNLFLSDTKAPVMHKIQWAWI